MPILHLCHILMLRSFMLFACHYMIYPIHMFTVGIVHSSRCHPDDVCSAHYMLWCLYVMLQVDIILHASRHCSSSLEHIRGLPWELGNPRPQIDDTLLLVCQLTAIYNLANSIYILSTHIYNVRNKCTYRLYTCYWSDTDHIWSVIYLLACGLLMWCKFYSLLWGHD